MAEPKQAKAGTANTLRTAVVVLAVLAAFFLGFAIARSNPATGLSPFSLLAIGVLAGATAVTFVFAVARAGGKAPLAPADGIVHYHRLFRDHPQPILVFDAESLAFLDVNDAAVRQYGHTREEFLGMTARDIRPPEEIPTFLDVLHRAGTFDPTPGTYRHQRKDGSVFSVEVTSHVIDFEGRRARAVLVRDVTERARAEQELWQTHALLEAVVDGSPLAIILLDRDRKVRLWNRAAERDFGYSADEVLGRRTPHVPEDQVAAFDGMWERFMAGEMVSGLEVTRQRRDGSRIDILLSTAPILDPQGRFDGVVGVLADITERKQLEVQARQAQKLEAIGRLAGGVAHDFNNLLTAINGYAQLTLESMDPTDPRRIDITEILHGGERAATLTRQLLAFSRRQVLQPRAVDINDLITAMMPAVRRMLRDDIALTVRLADGAGSVLVDPGELELALLNLVTNALEAIAGSGRIEIRTATAHLDEDASSRFGFHVEPGSYALLSVTDDGPGMDNATLAQVFDPFFSTKDPAAGTGLGLSTVYGTVKQSGGYIRAQSEPGRGTAFEIYLPRHLGRVERVAAAEPMVVEAGARQQETILLVEDEPAVRALARRILQRSHYHVLEAGSGGEALAMAATYTGHIHLLLTDVVMPEMNGRELAEQLRPLRPGMKVLYMSGYTEDAVVHEGVREGNEHFLEKPFTPAGLTATVRELLDRTGSSA